MLARIALRNLFRSTRRTLFSLVVISFGTTALLMTAGFVRYSFDSLRDALIDGGLGHLEVAPTAAVAGTASVAERLGAPPALEDWQGIRAAIESRAHVRAAAAVIQFSGVATTGDRTTAFIGIGVEPARESLMGTQLRMRGGTNLRAEEPAERADEAIVGTGLARSIGAVPGDTISLMTATPDGSLNAIDVTITGTFSTGLQDMDARIIKTHLLTAQRLLGTAAVSSLIVGLDRTEQTATAQGDLNRALQRHPIPLTISTWEERAPFYGQVRGLYGGIFAFLGTIVAVPVVLSTSNTLAMSVMERIREFGTLLAIGTSRGQVERLLMLEALWLGILGTLLGSVIAIVLIVMIQYARIEMPPPPGAADPMQLALSVRASDFGWAMVLMTAILLVAALPPLLRVRRLRIIDALEHI